MIVDNFSQMSIANRLPGEKAGPVLQTVISSWVNHYGVPRQIFPTQVPFSATKNGSAGEKSMVYPSAKPPLVINGRMVSASGL